MLVCVRECGVPLRLIAMSTVSMCVPYQCERSAFARGVHFSVIRCWVSSRLLSLQYLYFPI
jgi:hypothetical protein